MALAFQLHLEVPGARAPARPWLETQTMRTPELATEDSGVSVKVRPAALAQPVAS